MITENSMSELKNDRGKREFLLLIAALAIGMGLRLIGLGGTLFTGNELKLVYQAFQISQQTAVSSSSAPAYTGLTSLLFFLIEPSNFIARLLPALIGSSIIAVPWFWRDKLRTKTSLILSFAMAIDPTFVVFSRAINGGIFAFAGILWALTLFRIRKPVLAGIALGIAFLGGVSFWNYLVLLAVVYIVTRLIEPSFRITGYCSISGDKPTKQFAMATTGFVITIVIVCTSFLLDPSGMGGAGSGILEFFNQFASRFEKPIYHSIYLVIAHSILPIVLFFIGLFKTQGKDSHSVYRIVGLSVAFAIVFSMLISRSSFELLLFPTFLIWTGGAFWLSDLEIKKSDLNLTNTEISIFILSMLIYIFHNARRLSALQLSNPQFSNISLMIIAGVILIILTWWLLIYACSKPTGNRVVMITLLVFIAVISLSSVFRGIGSDQAFRWNEYLDDKVLLPNKDIEHIHDEFALMGKPPAQVGSYQIAELPEEMGWYFRQFAIERSQESLSMLLTRSSEMPQSSVELRGMNVVLERSVNWFSNTPSSYLRLLVGGKPQFENQNAVLWVRTNLFTGANQ